MGVRHRVENGGRKGSGLERVEAMLILQRSAAVLSTASNAMRHETTLLCIDAVARAGSIRGAAERLCLTSTALNRRILQIEDELGTPIFERSPHGVRPSVAGEIFIDHVRRQLSDMARVRSRIADLSGERRGHVRVACTAGLLADPLVDAMQDYRATHPAVTFAVEPIERDGGRSVLESHVADLALTLEGESFPECQVMFETERTVELVCARTHPLAAKSMIRLSDCVGYPMALPATSHAIRVLLERAALRLRLSLSPAITAAELQVLEACVPGSEMIAFALATDRGQRGAPADIVRRSIDARDLARPRLSLAQWRGRTLPVASARFAELLCRRLSDEAPDG